MDVADASVLPTGGRQVRHRLLLSSPVWQEALINIGIRMFPTRQPVDVAVVAQHAEALGEAGADAAAVMLTSASEAAALVELEQLAQQVL